MSRLSHISNLFATEPALALARAMIAGAPFPFSAVFFANSGTEANEAALKYARLHALRTKGAGHDRLLCFSNAFHGRTMGALSCTPNAKYQDPFLPLLPGCWCRLKRRGSAGEGAGRRRGRGDRRGRAGRGRARGHVTRIRPRPERGLQEARRHPHRR